MSEDAQHAAVESGMAAEPSFLATLIGLAFLMNMVGRGVTETFAVFLLPVMVFTILLRKHLLRGITFGAVRK